ncbi:MAG: class B sortase [Ruminococcaceae bacterium]|nr:class B sortase [Oscillospiraceae bacterium]
MKHFKKRGRSSRKTGGAHIKHTKRGGKNVWLTAGLIFCFIMLLTVLFLCIRSRVIQAEFHELAQLLVDNSTSSTVPDDTFGPNFILDNDKPAENTDGVDDTDKPEESVPTVKTMLARYEELYNRNNDLFGWIKIEDTVINYPVMRPNDGNGDKYLHTNFNGQYSYAGTPFAEIECSNESDNILIYAHRMNDGSMFGNLHKYQDKSYWEKHPTVLYSNLYEDRQYEILAVFYDRIYKKTDTCFKFYQFIDAENEEDFDYAISQFKEKSIYDTGVDAEYGDQLITLVTCDRRNSYSRFVVVARYAD